MKKAEKKLQALGVLQFFHISAIVFVLLFTVTACRENNIPDDTPSCIRKKIREIKSRPVENPPLSVWKYSYKGEAVYYIPPHCCDAFSQLFDKDCNLICSPDGGFTGMGDEQCPDFYRANEELIWQDSRK